MINLISVGRGCFGIAIAETGLQTIYYRDFPYWLLPPNHASVPGVAAVTVISGVVLFLAGLCVVIDKATRPVALLLGGALLLIFCLYYIPSGNYSNFVAWENAEKTLALSGGAFIIAGSVSEKNENSLIYLLGKLIPFGPMLFAIPIVCFGIIHFILAKEASTMVPPWIPHPLFWTYVAGVALLGSGAAIILKIRIRLIATLLGLMIFSWVIMIHIPRVIAATPYEMDGELTSAFIAMAYCGIALAVAGWQEEFKMDDSINFP